MPGDPDPAPGPSGVVVEQGPEWLVQFYLAPPAWLRTVVLLVGVAAAVAVVAVLRRRGGRVTLAQQGAMLTVAGTVVGVLTGVLAMANYAGQPYAVDVAVGFLAGYGTTLAAPYTPAVVPWLPADPRRRVVVGWVALAACALVLPPLAAGNGRGTMLDLPRYYLVLLAVVMVYYDLVLVDELGVDVRA